MHKLSTTLFFALAVACAGCATKPAATTTASDRLPTTMPSEPLTRPLVHAAGDRVEVQSGETWAQLTGNTAVTGIRAPNRGAAVHIGPATDPQAMIWLRGGTSVTVSETDRGAVFLSLDSGRARVRVLDPQLTVYARSSSGFAAISDALIEHDGKRAVVAATEQFPHRAAWTLAVAAPAPEAAGFGRLETSSEADTGASLELRRVRVNVTTHAGYASTEIEHIFYNEADQVVEGTFRFPVPDGAMIQGMAMEIDGRLMEAEIVEKDKARRTYEEIVDNMLDPALLEWEEGNWFKLRIFPIEANSEKRLVLRYAAPLTAAVDGWEYVYNVAAPEDKQRVGELELVFNGQTFDTMTDLSAGREIVIPISYNQVPRVSQETRADGIYTAVRIRPDWDAIAAPKPERERKLLVLVDTSRSSMEGRRLALETLDAVLSNLGEKDSFLVAATDLTTRAASTEFSPASEAGISAARSYIDDIEPDGASNLQAAIEFAAASSATEVVYIGDGTPTWGETDRNALIELAGTRLSAIPLHAAVIGKGADLDMWRELSSRVGGRASRPRTSLAARQFAFFVGHAPSVARIESAKVSVANGTAIFPTHPTTLFHGDELVAVMRTAPDQRMPTEVRLTGRRGDRSVEHTVSLAEAKNVQLVSQRWAVQQMAALEADGGNKEQIVELSKDFGILSRHTSLLVLESEEMYKQFQIERRRGPQQLVARNDQDPTVTGGDLDNLGGQDAHLSPDTIQPGDPEITVPAPADARSVVVVFPFGDTKIARYDEHTQSWVVRFLIDKDTPDGKYVVTVKVTHADGQIQTLRLPYFVDTSPPDMKLTVTRTDSGYTITARQKKAAGDVVHRDATRVELWLPNGESLGLTQVAWGKFEREWVPEQPLSGPVTLDVVVTDRALNQATTTITIDPEAQ